MKDVKIPYLSMTCKVQYTFKLQRKRSPWRLGCVLQTLAFAVVCHAVLKEALYNLRLETLKNTQRLAPLLHVGNTISWTWHNTLPAHTTPMMYSYEHLLSHPDNPTLVPHKSLFQSQLEISLKAPGMDKLHYTREGPAISISELGRAHLRAKKNGVHSLDIIPHCLVSGLRKGIRTLTNRLRYSAYDAV